MYEYSAEAIRLGAFRDDSMSEEEFTENALPNELEELYPDGIPGEVLEAYYESLEKGDEDE